MPELPQTTGLTATPDNGQVTLRWDAIAGATGWYLQQRSEGGQYGPVQKNLNPSAIHGSGFSHPVIAYSHTITGLDNNTRYVFRVGMTNGNCEGSQCEGPPSEETSATPRAFLPPPANLRATPADGQVTLNWDAVPGATGYQWTVFDNFNNWRDVPAGQTTVTTLRRPNGVVHSFRVRTVHTVPVGDPPEEVTIHSVPSDKALATPLANPTLPAPNLSVESGDGYARLSWEWHGRHNHPLVGATGYEYRMRTADGSYPSDGDGGGWTSVGDIFKPPKTWHKVTGLSSGVQYCFQLRARNGTIPGMPSVEQPCGNAVGNANPPAAPPDPVDEVRVIHKGSSLEVSWDAPDRATHYDVTYSGNGTNARAAWNHPDTSVTITCDSRYPDENKHCVNSGVTYTVGVRARNAAGHSDWVNSEPATPPALLSVADATAAEPGEGQSATLDFVVTLNPAASAAVTVDYGTSDGTATAGADYTATNGTLTFTAGETSKTVSVIVLGDSHNEGNETLTLTLSNAVGAVIDDGEATGTITNDGPIPQAWIARFGRTVAHQVLDAVQGRMQTDATPGRDVVLAGIQLGNDDHGDRGQETAGFDAPTVSGSELLSSSSFHLTAETAGSDITWSVWGQGAVTRFDGRDGHVTLDGTVTTALLGADWNGGQATSTDGETAGEDRWRAGLLLSHSTGEGSYDGAADGDSGSTPPGMAGTVKARLTGFFPWLRRALNSRLAAWGLAGYGQGNLTVTPTLPDNQSDTAALKADLNLWLAAGGLSGTLLEGGSDGLTLTATTDAMVVATSSGQATGDGGNLAPAQAMVTRLRTGLAASRPLQLDSGVTLTPALEMGLRFDGGDAETGFGIDLGGGVTLSSPDHGWEMELRGRGLLSHAADGFRDRGLSASLSWQQQPDSHLGAALSLTQTVGGASSGGADALLNLTTLESLGANDNGGNDLNNRRLELQLSYGLPVLGDRFSLSPELELGLYDSGRDYRIGWSLKRLADGESFDFSLDVTRREHTTNDGAPHEHGIQLNLDTRF